MNESLRTEPLNLAELDAAAILDSLPDGAYITDTTRRILFWNRAAEQITGWQRERVLGHRCHDNILCHIDKDGHRLCGNEHCPLHRAMVTGTRSGKPMLLFAKRDDGSRVPVEVAVAPIRDATDTVVGGIEIFRDLSPAQREMNRARRIQRDTVGLRLAPDERFAVRLRYTPHDELGGDFYRGETLPDGRLALLLADVVGHGISAALYTMQLRSLWEEGRGLLAEPDRFLAWLSGRVEQLTDDRLGYFATAVHTVYEPDTGRFRLGVAGHPPPVLVRSGASQAERLQTSGPGLGLLPEPEFELASGTLAPGDQLLLFTDGAFEITNASDEELGEEKFIEWACEAGLERGEAALTELEENLLRYSNRLSLPDDLTLIQLERKG